MNYTSTKESAEAPANSINVRARTRHRTDQNKKAELIDSNKPDLPDDWRNQAACKHVPPELFFPAGKTGLFLEMAEAAKQVCDGCRSKQPCREYALATTELTGVWGGTTEHERADLRRQQRDQT